AREGRRRRDGVFQSGDPRRAPRRSRGCGGGPSIRATGIAAGSRCAIRRTRGGPKIEPLGEVPRWVTDRGGRRGARASLPPPVPSVPHASPYNALGRTRANRMEIRHFLFERITLDPEKCFGKPCVRG